MNFADELTVRANRIYNLILHSDLEWIDIQIQINQLREFCLQFQPEKVELFDALYGGRFSRLWEQWRLKGDTSWTWREGGGSPGELV